MNQHAKVEIRHSTCPHDCPSACALDVDVIDGRSIGRVRGSKLQTYTAGVVCAKVARYAERIHHPDRLTHPLRRTGPKGSGQFARISWDEALDEIADRFNTAERTYGAQSVWPYYYAGTMGLVMRHGISRLAHVKKYSRFYSTICSSIARVGFAIGTGTDVAIESADLMKSDPYDVVGVVELSHATLRKMHQNLWWAVGYNVIAFPLAAGILYPVLLSPEIAAFAMSGSTLIVAINALMLKRTKLAGITRRSSAQTSGLRPAEATV